MNGVLFVSPIGVEDLDSSQDITGHLGAAPAPAPPPKNAARILALALAEPAPQVSVQSQSSGLCTPPSPPSSQDATHFQESQSQALFRIVPEEGPVASGLAPPLPNSPTSTAAPATTSSPSCPIASSPTIKLQPLDLPTSVVKLSDDTRQTEPGSTLSDPPQGPGSPGLASSLRKVPEQQQQQSFSEQNPVETNSSSHTSASNPSGSCRDSRVSSKPEVRLIFLSSELHFFK